jgi:hypothetical protein
VHLVGRVVLVRRSASWHLGRDGAATGRSSDSGKLAWHDTALERMHTIRKFLDISAQTVMT